MGHGQAIAAAVLLAIVGCGTKHPADKVTRVDKDDPKMNAAIAKARANVKTFITALKSPAGRSGFSIKMGFTDGDQTEHMWLSPVSYDGAKFTGKINNEPEMVKSVKLGQTVSATPDQISDWMYLQGRKLVGGETLRVLRDSMSPQERADFDKSVPFTLD